MTYAHVNRGFSSSYTQSDLLKLLDEHREWRESQRFSRRFVRGLKDVAEVGRDIVKFYGAPFIYQYQRHRYEKEKEADMRTNAAALSEMFAVMQTHPRRNGGAYAENGKKDRKKWLLLLGGAAGIAVLFYLLRKPEELPKVLGNHTIAATDLRTGIEVYNNTTVNFEDTKRYFLEFLQQRDLRVNTTTSMINTTNLTSPVLIGIEAPERIWKEAVQGTAFSDVRLNFSGQEPQKFGLPTETEFKRLAQVLDKSDLIKGFVDAKVAEGKLGRIAFNPEQFGFIADNTDKIFAVKSARPLIESRDFAGVVPYAGPQLFVPEQQLQVKYLVNWTEVKNPLINLGIEPGIFVGQQKLQVGDILLKGVAANPAAHNVSNVRDVMNFYGLLDSTGNASLNSVDVFLHKGAQGSDVTAAIKSVFHAAISQIEEKSQRVLTVIGESLQAIQNYISGFAPPPIGGGGGGGGGAPAPAPTPTPTPTPTPPPVGVTGTETACLGGRLPNTINVTNVTC